MVGVGMDGPAFMRSAEGHLNPIAPIMSFAIKKQLNDLKVTAETLTPDQARKFIERIVSVIKTFAPPAKVEEVRQALLREFRRAAPEYADKALYGGK